MGAVLLTCAALVASLACGPAASGGQDGGGVADRGDRDRGAADGDVTPGASPGQVVRTTTIRVGGQEVTVEVADTPALRERGLMYRDSLPPGHGMLFVYAEPQILNFWMRNTRIPLDIAYIDRGGTIVDIQHMEPQSDEQHVSSEPALYALEMPRGWFEEHGVSVGDRVEL